MWLRRKWIPSTLERRIPFYSNCLKYLLLLINPLCNFILLAYCLCCSDVSLVHSFTRNQEHVFTTCIYVRGFFIWYVNQLLNKINSALSFIINAETCWFFIKSKLFEIIITIRGDSRESITAHSFFSMEDLVSYYIFGRSLINYIERL